MKEITRVDPVSLGKLQGFIGLAAGLLIGIFYAMFAGVSAAGFGLGGAETGVIIVLALVGVPIAYGLFGFIGGLIIGWLYNVAAGSIGGLEIELGGPKPARDPTATPDIET